MNESPYSYIVGDEFFNLCAKPDHVPKDLYEKFFGFLNKEHATTYYEKSDILNLVEDLEILKIRTMHKHTERELRALDEAGWLQVFNLCYAIAKKSSDGFLVKQYRTTYSHNGSEDRRVESKPSLLGRIFGRNNAKVNEAEGND